MKAGYGKTVRPVVRRTEASSSLGASSDPTAEKPTNKAAQPAAETAEPRGRGRGECATRKHAPGTGPGKRVPGVGPPYDRWQDRGRRRSSLRSFSTSALEHLEAAFFELKENAAPGVDGLTWGAYEAALDSNLADLHSRLRRGVYWALPSRRVYVPKPDGRQRPLAVAALEDKIAHQATIAVLNAIYEEDFLGFSYGIRPNRGQHDALDALVVGITTQKVNFILDADIRSYFESVSQAWLIRFL
jgi:RNA-directed DNA polymerase